MRSVRRHRRSVRGASRPGNEGHARESVYGSEAIITAAQNHRPVPPLPCRPPCRPERKRNGEPCALKGARTVRREAQGCPHRGRPRLPYGDGQAATEKKGRLRALAPRARPVRGTPGYASAALLAIYK